MSWPRRAPIASGRLGVLQRKAFNLKRQILDTRSMRQFQVKAAPSADNGNINAAEIAGARVPETLSVNSPDARFEVLGSPFSVLSVNLSASQNLYTRRGTLIGVGGKAENVCKTLQLNLGNYADQMVEASSTLSILEPVKRTLLGIPFLYQKISSTSPLALLVSTKSPITSFAVAHLDGTTDWMVTQRQALLAWTGNSLLVEPTFNRKLGVAHWGNTKIGGRGLIAIAGKGQVYQLSLGQGEKYVAHPSNVAAYTITADAPLPYRLRANVLQLNIPDFGLSKFMPDTRFFRSMRDSDTWKGLKKTFFVLRTWSRRVIWGDRLFLQFSGPTTILLQSRAGRVSDSLTAREIDEIADTEPGAVQTAVESKAKKKEKQLKATELAQQKSIPSKPKLNVASVGQDHKVHFEGTTDFEGLKKT